MKRLIIFIVCLLIGTSSVYSVTVRPSIDLELDPNLGSDLQEYSQASQILVVPLVQPQGIRLSPEDWLKGIHYYTTVRLGYPDVPFHYVIFPNGQVYRANKTGDEAKVNIEEVGNDAILVAYLADPNSTDFDEQAKSNIGELLLDIANRNHIEAKNIKLKNLIFSINLEKKTSKLEARDVVGSWAESFKSFRKKVETNYKPAPKKYNIEITGVKTPEESVKPGQTIIVEISVKNKGDNSIYGDGDSALLISKSDGKLSKFFLNGAWASQSQVSVLTENDVIRPGEEKTYQVKFNVPLYFGEQKESFNLQTVAGDRIADSEFEISLNVDKLDETVVEILSTGTGYLNVRSGDSGSAEIITKVSPGERYIMKKTGQYGYVQIDLGEGELGWVSQKYVKKIN